LPRQQGKIVINPSEFMAISRQAWRVGDAAHGSDTGAVGMIAQPDALR
jgi:hypothetical protein